MKIPLLRKNIFRGGWLLVSSTDYPDNYDPSVTNNRITLRFDKNLYFSYNISRNGWEGGTFRGKGGSSSWGTWHDLDANQVSGRFQQVFLQRKRTSIPSKVDEKTGIYIYMKGELRIIYDDGIVDIFRKIEPVAIRDPAHTVIPFPSVSTSPEILMDHLTFAFRQHDAEIFESLLDTDFIYSEIDSNGTKIITHNREEELDFIRGGNDERHPGIFHNYQMFEFDFALIKRWREFVQEHSGEEWEVFRGGVHIVLLDDHEEGIRIDQNMILKLRRDDEGIWKIIRWISEPIEDPTQDTWGNYKKSYWGDI